MIGWIAVIIICATIVKIADRSYVDTDKFCRLRFLVEELTGSGCLSTDEVLDEAAELLCELDRLRWIHDEEYEFDRFRCEENLQYED